MNFRAPFSIYGGLGKNYFPEWVVGLKSGETDGANLGRFDFRFNLT